MADQDEEFQEEDMWGFVNKEKENKSFSSSSSSSSSSCLSASWNLPMSSAPKMMTQKAKNVRSDEGKNLALQQSSSPLRIPGWSQNYKNSNKGFRGIDDQNLGKDTASNDYECVVENEEDEDEKMIPPHEYIAKKMARTRIASHSMCEGIGRTLKGRDLCKLRNAILTQTGFLEK